MSKDSSTDRPYHISDRLLASKGGASPVLSRGEGLVLSRDVGLSQSDDQRLADAIVDVTLELLSGPPERGKRPRGAAALTDLFDPSLTEAGRRRAPPKS